MLRGWCRTAGAERTFAVRRIEGLALEKGRIAVQERPVRTAGRVEEILVDSSKRWVAEEFDAVSALPDGDALRLESPCGTRTGSAPSSSTSPRDCAPDRRSPGSCGRTGEEGSSDLG